MKLRDFEEYNGVDTYFHGVSKYTYNQLVSGDKAPTLYGRVFNPNKELLTAEHDQDYTEHRGKGYVYATDYRNRYNATPGASSMSGPVLILGWNGHTYEPDVVTKRGEWLVPLEAYKVIAVWFPGDDSIKEFS